MDSNVSHGGPLIEHDLPLPNGVRAGGRGHYPGVSATTDRYVEGEEGSSAAAVCSCCASVVGGS